jgi:hypothetical protein
MGVHFGIAFGSPHQHSDSARRLAGLRDGDSRPRDRGGDYQADELPPSHALSLSR